MILSKEGQNLIKSFEGLRLHAYHDAANICTIGYGSTRYPDGSTVKPGDRLDNETQAASLFLNTLHEYEAAVNHYIKTPLSQHQFDALVSLTYNVGTGVMQGTTIARKLNAGDIAAAASQFLVWNKITNPVTGAKVVCDTLTKRRIKERNYFLEQ